MTDCIAEIQNSVVVIPALAPDHRLVDYLKSLSAAGIGHIVVVDDGSGVAYHDVFASVEEYGIVLTHEKNKGKGAALKTAFRYIRDNIKTANTILTADADGQHTVKDCIKVISAMPDNRQALLLGSRDFNLPDVPFKSRFGNKCTSVVFKLLFGCYLPDTQTGLRAFSSDYLPFMIEIQGDRYEYEMNVLIECVKKGIDLKPVMIDTIYENNNEGSHFNPVRDSFRIYRIMLNQFILFMGSSLVCVIIDQACAAILFHGLLPLFGITDQIVRVWGSGFIARAISASCNYIINKKVVFKSDGLVVQTAMKYLLLCVCIICLSNLGVSALVHLGITRWIAKLILDTLLYFVSFQAQNRWVFKTDV